MSVITDDVKTLLGTDNEKKLEVIERRTRQRLQVKMKVTNVPVEYEYIVSDVTIKRFNRIGNEGMQAYSQEGLSMTFPDSDFDEYTDEIDAFVEENNPTSEKRDSIARFY